MNLRSTLLVLAAAMSVAVNALAGEDRPTIVLVHGAFADSSSWNGVVRILRRDGYPVVSVANPLRSVSGDAAYVSDIVAGIADRVVLVGHSYGGMVISNAAIGHANVVALVFVSAFAPEAGESASALAAMFPGSTLGPSLAPAVMLSNGSKDLYIRQERFPAQFAADVPARESALMAVAQRPVTEEALNEKSAAAAWTSVPAWFIWGDQDRNIPPAAQAFMAERAHARRCDVVKGASHVVMVSHPDRVVRLIETAASSK